MPREISRAQRAELEALIDSLSLSAVVSAVGEICDDKADHIADNWQDTGLSKAWRRAAGLVGALSRNPHLRDISR